MEQMRNALLAVMAKHPFLSCRGFEAACVGIEAPRADLAASVDEFERAVAWLLLVPKRQTVNRDFDSYGLKHAAERWARAYVGNGALIAAALHLGFIIEPIDGSLNALIGVAGRSKWPKGSEI